MLKQFVKLNLRTFRFASAVCLLATISWAGRLHAGNIYVPNYSFESPATDYAAPDMDYWGKSPTPIWYDTNNGPWIDVMGEFANTAPTNSDYIDNCNGNQAAFLFALPDAAIFQDYTTTYGTNTTPSHAFNAKFETGKSYNLTVGLIGGGGGMLEGASIQFSLYYLDASNNMVTVGATNIIFTTNLFPTTTHFVDCQLQVPTVQASNAWAGQNIGIELLSTVDFTYLGEGGGGYWDLDNVRLSEVINVPNGSFESPVTDYAAPDMAYWEKSPTPIWYDTNNGPWIDVMGEFANTAPTNSDYIDNCDGNQAAFLFALPDAAIFQDYTTTYGTNTTPSHAFNAKFQAGKSYSLTVGVIGGGGGMLAGASLQLSLYYLDASNNLVTVAATNVIFTTNLFPTTTHFVDCTVTLPVKAGAACVGQNIGIELLSTVGFDYLGEGGGGYWDVDNVRLNETVTTALANPARSRGSFSFTLLSEPGLAFSILATSNLTQSVTNWASLTTLTNVTGSSVVTDPATNISQRFYLAHQVP